MSRIPAKADALLLVAALARLWSVVTMVVYMFSSFWQLGVKSHDFSHAEKERTACKAKQIHKMTTIFTQIGPRLSFE